MLVGRLGERQLHGQNFSRPAKRRDEEQSDPAERACE
jgi:hypothetical protein